MILIMGGGLSGCLLAYRLTLLKRPPQFLLIESSTEICGNHTWSFHHSDLHPEVLKWVEPLISKSWNHQEIIFPDHRRLFSQPYHSILSSEFATKIRAKVGDRIQTGVLIKKLSPKGIITESGQRIEARVILDARGLDARHPSAHLESGFQKFHGLDLELEAPHSLQHPIIMDATCEQRDGFRFIYCLPWSDTQILIEDTRYSDTSAFDPQEYRTEVFDYCRKRNWRVKSVLRQESAALPIPLFPFPEPHSTEADWVVPIGMKGNFFHLTTGYSLPFAAQTAEIIARAAESHPDLSDVKIRRVLSPLQDRLRQQSKYFALLNRMLFRAADPLQRWKVFSKFYRRPEDLIFRFYAGELTKFDQIRILTGKPPVPVFRAFQQLQL